MIEVAYDILTAWHELLDGISVPVYKGGSVLAKANENHVVVRFESESQEGNNSAFLKNPVIIVEVVTHFINWVDAKIAWDIMNECTGRIYSGEPGNHNIIMSKLYGIEEAGTNDVTEGESNPIVYRIVKRFLNRTIQ